MGGWEGSKGWGWQRFEAGVEWGVVWCRLCFTSTRRGLRPVLLASCQPPVTWQQLVGQSWQQSVRRSCHLIDRWQRLGGAQQRQVALRAVWRHWRGST